MGDTVGDPIVAGRDDRLTRVDGAVAISAPAPLLATKLYAPRACGNFLARPRLVERLKASVRGPLTLIAAPAGWGKTTLLSEWRASSADDGWPIGWVSLDTGDNDPVRFWTYVLAALNQAYPGVADAALALLHVSHPPAIDAALTVTVNAMADLPTDVVLVLDDYHLVTAQPIHTALASLLDHLPLRLHLLLASREDPPLPLNRLRLRGDLAELRIAELRFTPEEAASFLSETVGLPLSPEAVAALDARSEGWIAGLQLAALSTRGRSADQIEAFVRQFSGSHRYIVDYLIEEVLARQPMEVQDFLLRSAVLDRFCAPLCAALLVTDRPDETPDFSETSTGAAPATYFEASMAGDGAKDAIGRVQALLEEVERANLFLIPLDDNRQWYRYHHLFADVLQSRLRQLHPGLATALHRRASDWFEAQGFVAEAVQHALVAPDAERAAKLIERHGNAMGVAGQFATVLDWLQALPPAAVRVRPRLIVCHAAMLRLANRLEASERYLRDAEAAAAPAGGVEAAGVEVGEGAADHLSDDAADITRDQARAVLGMVAAFRGEIAAARGDMAASVSLARQALALLPESETLWRDTVMRGQAGAFQVTGEVTPVAERALVDVLALLWADGNVVTALGASSDLAYAHLLQGRLRDAHAVLDQAARRIPEAIGLDDLVTGPSYFVGMGDILREWNQLDIAERLLRQGKDLVSKTEIVFARVVALSHVALAKLEQARGNSADALAALDAFDEVAKERHFVPDVRASVAAARAQLQLSQGDVVAAVRWADYSGLTGDDAELPFLREREYLALARVRIAQGRATPTAPHLKEALHLLDRLHQEAKPRGRQGSVLEIGIIRALALQAQGRQPLALAALARALLLAEPEGYVRLFADEGAPMAALLARLLTAIRQGRLAASEATTAYIRTLLAACGAQRAQPSDSVPSDLSVLPGADRQPFAPSARPNGGVPPLAADVQTPMEPLITPLTEREVEVLRMLAEGAANAEIARMLVLRVGTVKKHVYNICAKLGAQSRTQAVARARAFNLL